MRTGKLWNSLPTSLLPYLPRDTIIHAVLAAYTCPRLIVVIYRLILYWTLDVPHLKSMLQTPFTSQLNIDLDLLSNKRSREDIAINTALAAINARTLGKYMVM